MSSAQWTPAWRQGAAGMLAGLALAWLLGGGRMPLPIAHAAPSTPDANGTFAITSGEPGGSQWLYLIDTRTQALAVYRVDPRNPKGAIKLEATRQYRWDLKLSEYNNQPPEVAAIESMVGNTKR